MTVKQGLAGSLKETTSTVSVQQAFFTVLLSLIEQQHSPQIYSENRHKYREEVLPSFFGSPKAVSRGGPNKAVVSSETGVCWLLKQKRDNINKVIYLSILHKKNKTKQKIYLCLQKLTLSPS